MTKITFIGAGSTVFTKNIAGDILQRPALADAEIRLMDINPQRLEESEIVVGKLAQTARRPRDGQDLPRPARARSTARTSSSSPSRSAATTPAPSPTSRCRRSSACARPSPTPSASAASCAASAPSRTSGRSARTCAQVAPERDHAPVRQPDGDQHLGHRREVPRRSARSASATRCRARRMELARDLDIPVEEIRYRAAGINHMAFYLNFEHRQPDGSYRDLYPALRRGLPRGPLPQAVALEPALPEQGALRDDDPARLLRHRELGALRRIHALVHQARPPRPDREVRHPARRIPQALRRADRPLGEAGRSLPDGRHDRGRERARNTPARSSTPSSPASRR